MADTAAANDNFRLPESKDKPAIFKALDYEYTFLVKPLVQGKLADQAVDLRRYMQEKNIPNGSMLPLADQYIRVPKTPEELATNAEVTGKMIALLGGTPEAKKLTEGYLEVLKFNELPFHLALHILDGYHTNTIVQEQDKENALKADLIQGLVDFGGVGKAQAEQLARRFATNVHDVAKKTLGLGI